MWLIMDYTGLRVSDVVRIKYGDISKDGTLKYISLKTGKAGFIKLPGELLALIGRRGGEEYVFKSSKSPKKHIHRTTVYRHIKKACRKVGIDSDGVSCHSARKSFAVRTFRENGLGKTMHMLQHSSPSTTLLYALSDNPIPRIYQEIRKIKKQINELYEICDMLLSKIVDVDAPLDVQIIEKGEP